jgi:hypothetical protein
MDDETGDGAELVPLPWRGHGGWGVAGPVTEDDVGAGVFGAIRCGVAFARASDQERGGWPLLPARWEAADVGTSAGQVTMPPLSGAGLPAEVASWLLGGSLDGRLRTPLECEAAHQRLVQALIGWAQKRLLSLFSNVSRFAGWLCFDLKDYQSAAFYYEEARTAAHEAQDVELGAFVLCNMSQMATWQGRPWVGIDHAAAAQGWAQRTDSPSLRAYAADVAARAFALDVLVVGQRELGSYSQTVSNGTKLV